MSKYAVFNQDGNLLLQTSNRDDVEAIVKSNSVRTEEYGGTGFDHSLIVIEFRPNGDCVAHGGASTLKWRND